MGRPPNGGIARELYPSLVCRVTIYSEMAHIVVIDDEKIILQMLRIFLASDGHDVVTISEGSEALKYISSEEPMDLLITDLRMDAINGLDVLKAAKTSRPDVPSMVLSAYYSEDSVREAKALGCHSFLRKPFTLDQMGDAISELLGEKLVSD